MRRRQKKQNNKRKSKKRQVNAVQVERNFFIFDKPFANPSSLDDFNNKIHMVRSDLMAAVAEMLQQN